MDHGRRRDRLRLVAARARRFNASMELRIDPEPSAEERATIVAALEQAGVLGAEPASAWDRPSLVDEPLGQAPGA